MPDERQQTLQVTRIIALAITSGPAIFLGVTYFLLHQPDSEFGASETGSMISYISLALALGAFAAYPVIPRVFKFREENPYHSFRATVIVRLAVAEFPALLGCVAYLLEGRNTPIGAGVALAMILFMAGMLPTGSRLDAWVHE